MIECRDAHIRIKEKLKMIAAIQITGLKVITVITDQMTILDVIINTTGEIIVSIFLNIKGNKEYNNFYCYKSLNSRAFMQFNNLNLQSSM